MALETETARLTARLGEEALATAPPPGKDEPEPPVARRGVVLEAPIHTLPGTGPKTTLVSLVVPADGGPGPARRVVARALSQQAGVRLEILLSNRTPGASLEALARELGTGLVESSSPGETTGLVRGDAVCLLGAGVLPGNASWLTELLRALENVDAAASRLLPAPDADPVAYLDGLRDLRASGSPAAWPGDEDLGRFHLASVAVRAYALAAMPLGSDEGRWPSAALAAGLRLTHAPDSIALWRPPASYAELFCRGLASAARAGELPASELEPLVLAALREDARFLAEERGLAGPELERWARVAALRRGAEAAGRWLGANHPAGDKYHIDATIKSRIVGCSDDNDKTGRAFKQLFPSGAVEQALAGSDVANIYIPFLLGTKKKVHEKYKSSNHVEQAKMREAAAKVACASDGVEHG